MNTYRTPNIHDHAIVKKSLQTNEEIFWAITDCSPGMLWISDTNGDLVFMNKSCRDFFGTQGKDPISLDWRKNIHPEEKQEYIETFAKAIDEHQPFFARTRVLRHDGQWRWCEFRANPIVDNVNCIIGYIGIANDITEIYRSRETLKIADKRKDEFLAVLAHELRNPLAPIGNAIQMLRFCKKMPEELGKIHDLIDRQVQQMDRLVGDLMDVSRIASGKIHLQKEYIKLSKIIDLAIEASKPLIDHQQHNLYVQLALDAPIVYADTSRITQVISNLLNNAAKYTKPGGNIWLSITSTPEYAIMSIRDTGIGISSDRIENIFDLFSQEQDALERAQGGLGIGLTLARNLIHLHDGKIEVHSDGIGKGSEFIVYLPIIKDEINIPPSESSAEKSIKSDKKYNVLIVDDNEASALTLGWLVELLGHEMRIAYEATEAIEIGKSFNPDFILMDIGLPGTNGYELCQTMKAMTEFNSSIFIAQTGWGQKEHRERSQDAGFKHHLVKPIKLQTLKKVFTEE
jgi:PAS domain S-box-containing protein